MYNFDRKSLSIHTHPTPPPLAVPREGKPIEWAANGGIACRACPTLPHTVQATENLTNFVYRKKNAESENAVIWFKPPTSH